MDFLTIIWILLASIIFFLIGQFIGRLKSEKSFKQRLLDARKDATSRSRAILQGQISEQIAPLFEDFKYDIADVRFIGKPIDFIVFEGLSKGEVERIVFLEVKTSSSKLTKSEKQIKDVVENKKVFFDEYRK